VYKTLSQYQNAGLITIAMQRGESFVVFMPLIRMHLEPAPMHYTLTYTDSPTLRSSQLLGDPTQASVQILTTEGKVHVGENLFATRCSIRFFNCATAFTSMPEVIQANRGKFIGCIALFGLLGAFASLFVSLLYRRNKGMEQQLRRAIAKDRIRVVYQPLVDLASGRIVGAEALARWTDEDGLAVGPDVFVRLAEQHGFVGEITRLVVRHVLRDFGPMLRTGSNFRVSVNVTAADLGDPGFLIMIERSLGQAGVAPRSLTIEITESSTVRHDLAMNAIRRLRQHGHSVHIDDFGTGYSSLSYLKDLSVDAIKIDKSFTQSIGTGSVTVAILPQILAMAEALGLRVIVEGVETIQQASYFTTAAQPVLAQGWLYGRPVPAAELQRAIAEEAKSQVGEAKMRAVTASAA